MNEEWYYVKGDETCGPVSMDALRDYLSNTSDWRSILIWKQGFDDWEAAGPFIVPPPVKKAAPPPPPTGPEVSIDRAPIPESVIQEPKKQSWFSRTLAASIGIVAFLVAGAVAKVVVREAMKPSEQSVIDSFDKALSQAEAQIRPTLPKKLDEITTFVSINHSGRTMIYGHRLELVKADLEPNAIQEKLKPVIVKGACDNKDMRASLNHGGAFRYSYVDKNGVSLGSIDVTNSDCR